MTNHATCNAFEQSRGYISCTHNYPPTLKSSAAKFVTLHEFTHVYVIILLFLYKLRLDPLNVEVSNSTHRRQHFIRRPTKVSGV
jgi:hypothetical protein